MFFRSQAKIELEKNMPKYRFRGEYNYTFDATSDEEAEEIARALNQQMLHTANAGPPSGSNARGEWRIVKVDASGNPVPAEDTFLSPEFGRAVHEEGKYDKDGFHFNVRGTAVTVRGQSVGCCLARIFDFTVANGAGKNGDTVSCSEKCIDNFGGGIFVLEDGVWNFKKRQKPELVPPPQSTTPKRRRLN
jgi:hypothetical protein